MELSLAELQQATGGTIRFASMPPRDREQTLIEGIAIDSRRLLEGELFWALAGEQRSGDDFVGDAFHRGAVGSVTESKNATALPGTFVLEVEDSRRALRHLGDWNRARSAARLVAVTGSVGKTTTREMIHAVLSSRFEGVASPANYNNALGVPLSLAEIELTHDYAVLELGANQVGEIAPLARLCRPNIGVITGIADAHLGGFGSADAIAETKWELARELGDNGLLVLNGDDFRLRRLAKHRGGEIVWFGRSGDCDVVAERIHYRDGLLSFYVESQQFELSVWGRHHLNSALAAIAVGTAFGLTFHEIADALARFQPVRGRCSVARSGGLTVIDDTYNASPAGMLAALDLLRESTCQGRKILVAGDMGELGEASGSLHATLGEWIAEGSPKLLFACGEFAANVSAGSISAGMSPDRVIVESDPLELLEQLQEKVRPGDLVLVKGCRAMGLERIVDRLAAPRLVRAAM